MEEYIPEVLSTAFSFALHKKGQIDELGITPDMPIEAKNELVRKLSTEFVESHPDFTFEKAVPMIRKNVTELIAMSSMDGKGRLDAQYNKQLINIVKDTSDVDAMAQMLS